MSFLKRGYKVLKLNKFKKVKKNLAQVEVSCVM